MRRLALAAIVGVAVAWADTPPDLPVAVSNNAATSVRVNGTGWVYSFAGIGGELTANDIHARVYRYRTGASDWERLPDVPGGVGRLAASAVSVGDAVYLFGGYQVFADGSERSLPDVWRIDAASGRFERQSDMPVPVDDSVALVYAERYIYLVSGWHDVGNVNLVQRYDTATDAWTQATPWPGPPVFGHVGALAGNSLVVCDGVAIDNATLPRRFVMSDACYQGQIDEDDARRIHWQALPPHPGAACYRAVAAASADGEQLLFAGGGDNPYNYNGTGYNRIPARPCRHRYSYDLAARRWLRERPDPDATMDTRALVSWDGGFVALGGLASAGEPTTRVRRLPQW